MKKNEKPFTEATRQSIFAIALIIVKYIRVIFRQIWPLILLFLVGGSTSRKTYLLYLVVGVAIFSMLWAIIAYFKYYFYLKGNELIIERGVLRKIKLTIPLERVQSINFQQNIIHRFFNVIQFDIDTAGSKGNEFSFDALSIEKANLLREIILSHKNESVLLKDDEENMMQSNEISILHLKVVDLLKIGISQNHFRSGALIFIALFWVLEGLDEVGMNTENIVEDTLRKGLEAGLFLFIFLLIAFLVISFLISLFRTIVNYYDLSLYRLDNRYKLVAGLFTKKETAVIDRKIQIIEWSDNIIKKLFKYYDLKLKQASSVAVNAKSSIRIPGCYLHHIELIKKNWLGETAEEGAHKEGVSIHYFYRRLLYRLIFAILFGLASYLVANWLFFALAIALIPYFVSTSWMSYKKAGFALNDQIIAVSQGMFGDKYAIMPLYKIQSIRIRQTPYQQRKSLANLDIFSASGNISVPYISFTLALQLHNYLSYKVLASKKRWM